LEVYFTFGRDGQLKRSELQHELGKIWRRGTIRAKMAVLLK